MRIDYLGVSGMGLSAFTIIALIGAPSVAITEKSPDLRSYAPPASRCAFSTVGGRKPVTVAYQRSEAKGRLFCFDQPHCRCQVRYVDLPDSARDLSLMQIANRFGFAHWSKKGKYKREKAVKTGEHEGEECTVIGLPNGPSKPFDFVQVRVFIAGKRAFFVSAACSDAIKPNAGPEIKAFLESFRIVEE